MADYCIECNAPLLPGSIDCKICGWKAKGVSVAAGGRPILADLEADMVQVLRTSSSDHPTHGIPKDENAAIDWFMRLVEPEHRTERPQEIRNKSGQSWRWTYADRVLYLLRKYLVAPLELQQLVVAAREDGIFWRGDDYPFFVCVIDETEKMRDLGLVEYRRQARAAMGSLNLGATR